SMPWTTVQALARDLPETALCVTSRRRTSRFSTAPFTWAIVWPREVVDGGVNYPHIDGKDGVAQSALRPATAGHTAAVSGRPLVIRIRPTQRFWRSRHSSTVAESWPQELLVYTTTNPISPPPYSFSSAAAYRTNQRL